VGTIIKGNLMKYNVEEIYKNRGNRFWRFILLGIFNKNGLSFNCEEVEVLAEKQNILNNLEIPKSFIDDPKNNNCKLFIGHLCRSVKTHNVYIDEEIEIFDDIVIDQHQIKITLIIIPLETYNKFFSMEDDVKEKLYFQEKYINNKNSTVVIVPTLSLKLRKIEEYASISILEYIILTQCLVKDTFKEKNEVYWYKNENTQIKKLGFGVLPIGELYKWFYTNHKCKLIFKMIWYYKVKIVIFLILPLLLFTMKEKIFDISYNSVKFIMEKFNA
jgi:hypothetical protein